MSSQFMSDWEAMYLCPNIATCSQTRIFKGHISLNILLPKKHRILLSQNSGNTEKIYSIKVLIERTLDICDHLLWTEQQSTTPPSSQSSLLASLSSALLNFHSFVPCIRLGAFLGWAGQACPALPLSMKTLSAFNEDQIDQLNQPGLTKR